MFSSTDHDSDVSILFISCMLYSKTLHQALHQRYHNFEQPHVLSESLSLDLGEGNLRNNTMKSIIDDHAKDGGPEVV